ncbi:MAG: hypothetical protein ACXV5Q_01360 [Frankiaceae bacterium]
MSATWEVGDAVPLTWTLTVNGTPTNATVTLVVTAPDGTTSSPAVSNPSTGNYTATYLPTLNGLHSYRWAATGAAIAADTQTFVIGGLVSLSEARTHLSIPSSDTSNDAKLQGFIDACTSAVEDITGPILPRSIVGEVHDGGSPLLTLRFAPVISIQSVTEYVGVTAYALTSQPQGSTTGFYGYDLVDTNGGVLVRRDSTGNPIAFQGGRYGVTVSYTAGYSIVPNAVRLGALMLIQHWWDSTQQGFGAGGGAFSPDDGTTNMPGFAVPNFVAQQLTTLPSSKSKIPGIA